MVVNHVPRAVLHKATNLRGGGAGIGLQRLYRSMQTSSFASFLPVSATGPGDFNYTKTDGTRKCRPPDILRDFVKSRWKSSIARRRVDDGRHAGRVPVVYTASLDQGYRPRSSRA